MGGCSSHEDMDRIDTAEHPCPSPRAHLEVSTKRQHPESLASDDHDAVAAEIRSLVQSCKLMRYGTSGYVRETYRKAQSNNPGEEVESPMSAIIYLIDQQSTCFWTVSKSDQAHYYHGGSGIFVDLVDPTGTLYTDIRLGLGPVQTDQIEFIPQIIVPSGWFKRYRFVETDTYCLFGGAIAAGLKTAHEEFVKTADLRERIKYLEPTKITDLCRNCHDFTPGEGRKKRKLLPREVQDVLDRKILNVHE